MSVNTIYIDEDAGIELKQVKLPIESYGKCIVCHKIAILGDGHCYKCYDTKISYYKNRRGDSL